MPTIVEGFFEWDANKARANTRKHRVTFAEAVTVLDHPDVRTFEEGAVSGRYKSIGMSKRGRMLAVVHEERGERDRIVSAWSATKEELRQYLIGG
jgi:uncharacterized DUF497 family protein